MTFPNGYKGVKKLFTAEILALISSVLLVAAGIAVLVALAGALTAEGGAASVGLIGTSVFSIIAGILVIIAYILKLVGLKQAGKDSYRFHMAFTIAICTLNLAIISGILNAIFGANSVIDDIVQLIQRIANIVVIFMVIMGIQDFADQLHNDKMANRGNTVTWIIAIPYILSAIAGIIPGFFGANGTTGTISGVMLLISGILGIIGSIMYLVYLGQAKKMLKNN